MTDAIIAGKVRPKYLNLFLDALALGYSVDTQEGKAYRPDGTEWVPRVNGNGYLSLQAKINSQHLHIPLHKAIAYMLWGDSAVGGPSVHVRHLDSNKLNCRGENLALGSAYENALDKPASMRKAALVKRAETLGKARLSEIASQSAATRGRDASVAFGRLGGKVRQKLTPAQVAMVRDNAGKPKVERITQRDLATMLGVKQGTICDILAGRCYGDVGIECAGLGEY